MGHFIDGNSCNVQRSACDVTMLNYVTQWDVDDANICIVIVVAFLIVINSLSLYSTSLLPGFARVPYYAPIPCHMHPLHNCNHIAPFLPSVPQTLRNITSCWRSAWRRVCYVIERRACEKLKNYRQHYLISRQII